MHYSAICNNGEAVKRNEGMRTIKFCRPVIIQNKFGHRNTVGVEESSWGPQCAAFYFRIYSRNKQFIVY